jgi:hypothetical protein
MIFFGLFFSFLLISTFIGIAGAPFRLIAFLSTGPNAPPNDGWAAVSFRFVSDVGCMIVLPLVFLLHYNTNGYPGKEMFANGGAVFWGVWIFICAGTYFVESYTRGIKPLVCEFVLNLLLGAGIVINLFVGFDLASNEKDGLFLSLIGNGPIILLFLIALEKRKLLFHRHFSGMASEIPNEKPNVLDYLPTQTDTAFDFSDLSPPRAFFARVLAGSFFSRLGIFMVSGFLAVSAGLLLANLLGYDWF